MVYYFFFLDIGKGDHHNGKGCNDNRQSHNRKGDHHNCGSGHDTGADHGARAPDR